MRQDCFELHVLYLKYIINTNSNVSSFINVKPFWIGYLLIWFNNVYLDALKKTSQAATSNVDLSTLKTVKIMVEKLDYNMYVNKLHKIK